jgi:SAM-dependent methyltransferase
MNWDERFASEDFLFGEAPSQFTRRQATRLTRGESALCVAEGEGRNAVFLAECGLNVTAFDSSPVALRKARRLAEARGVEVSFVEADAATFDWSARRFDVVLAVFIQFAPPPLRSAIFSGMIEATAPNGLILLHGYTPKQVEYGTGGPPFAENMYTPQLLREAFSTCEILELQTYEADLQEGRGHSGRSALIDLVAQCGRAL